MTVLRTEVQQHLNDECASSGSDKACLNHTFAGYNYMDHYGALFETNPRFYEETEINIFEIGVLGGNSLRLWRRLFPLANIVGLDSDPAIQSRVGAIDKNTHLYVGNQSDKDLLLKINQERGPFDLVIDDGSHSYEDMLTSAITLLPRLNFNGLYVIEDINVAWPMPEWPGMRWSQYSPNDPSKLFEFLNTIMAGINMRSGPVLSMHYFHGMIAFRRADSFWHP